MTKNERQEGLEQRPGRRGSQSYSVLMFNSRISRT